MATYDPNTALIVVDVQNDFADPNGSLYVREGDGIIPAINDEIERAVEAGATVVYTQDWHPGSTPHFQKDGGMWPVHCVRETWGAELHPQLKVQGDVVKKGTGGEDGYSGFTVRDPVSGQETPTELEGVLRSKGIERIVVVGLATDYCVKETAVDGAGKGFATTVLRGLTRAVELQPGDEDKAVADMERAGARIE